MGKKKKPDAREVNPSLSPSDLFYSHLNNQHRIPKRVCVCVCVCVHPEKHYYSIHINFYVIYCFFFWVLYCLYYLPSIGELMFFKRFWRSKRGEYLLKSIILSRAAFGFIAVRVHMKIGTLLWPIWKLFRSGTNKFTCAIK